MILVAGLTPAWQQIIELDRLDWGEVNRARAVHWCASGKVTNVAIALAQLHAPHKAITFLGGRNGELIAAELESLGVSLQAVRTAAATRVCTTLLDAASGQTTELVENAGSVTPAELATFEQAFAAAAANAQLVLLTGSLPAGTPSGFYDRLLAQVTAPAILDIRGSELLSTLARRPLVVKPNREELGQTVGRALEHDTDLVAAMQHLRFLGAEWVVVSSGKDPLWAAGPAGVWKFWPPSATVVNPIASGDCLAAGIAAALAEGHAMREAICWGLAAAAQNVAQLLPARLDREQLAAAAAMIKSESIA